jgi:hypothetical protein
MTYKLSVTHNANSMRLFRWSWLLVMAAMGCGSGQNLAPVSGQVTLNGKPVAEVAVTFQPVASEGNNAPGPTAVGVTDSSGRYSLKPLGDQGSGATIGKNQVKFSANVTVTDTSEEGLRKMKAAVQIPPRYWSDSKIEFDVPKGGASNADFQLTSP